MVGWHLLLLLLAEVAGYGAWARHLHVAQGWTLPQAIVLVLSVYVSVRLVLVGAEFILAHWKGDPIPSQLRVPPARLAAMYLRETAGWLLLFSLILPFIRSRRSVIDRAVTRPVAGLPVLLLHGLACNRGNWFWFRRQLEARGYAVFTVDVTPPFACIGGYAPQVARAIDDILEATGTQRIVLIGHSMGGLVARAYLDQFGPEKVAHVITLGSPANGTWMARLAVSASVRDMDIDSPWLAALRERELQRSITPYRDFTCIYSLHDNLVVPQTSSGLPGAQQIVLSGVGHLTMVLSSTVLQRIVTVLERVTAEAGRVS